MSIKLYWWMYGGNSEIRMYVCIVLEVCILSYEMRFYETNLWYLGMAMYDVSRH